MAQPWFRFYHEVLDDPKVQKLDGQTFKHWVNLLCLAARNEGKLPDQDDMAFALRLDIIALKSLVDRLLIAGLIEVRKGGANGSYIAPNGWDKRQYKSDSSSERVKRYRQRSQTVTVTPPDTDTDTDTDTDITPLNPPKGGVAKPDDLDPIVWRDWLRARRKPPTETAMARISREAEKAGITLADAIREAAENGWQGFKADWLKGNGNERNGKSAGGNGVASALDKRIGSDGFTRAPGRSAIGYGGCDSGSAAPRIASLR